MKKQLFRLLSLAVCVAMLFSLAAVVHAEEVGSLTVTGGENGVDYSYEDGVLTVLTDTALTVSTQEGVAFSNDRIAIAEGVDANITLAGLTIKSPAGVNAAIDASKGGDVTITLADGTKNNLTAGGSSPAVKKSNVGTLTINCASSEEEGHECSESCGALVATGSTLAGPGIGAASRDTATDITINGGVITATGAANAAGIGSGNTAASIENLTINGGIITATGGKDGAGIGGGANGGTAKNIVINGGVIVATTSSGNGAGIGGGAGGSLDGFTMNGGTVTATAKGQGAGIGGGAGSNKNNPTGTADNIVFNDGTVVATGGQYCGGIGGGRYSALGNVEIHGGKVTAIAGGSNVAIGGASDCTAENPTGTITIDGGTLIATTATEKGVFGSEPVIDYFHVTYGNGERAEANTLVEWTGSEPVESWTAYKYVKIQPVTYGTLSIVPDAAKLEAGESVELQATVSLVFPVDYPNTDKGPVSPMDVTAEVEWTVSGNASETTAVADGALTLGEDETARTITLEAAFEGLTATATFNRKVDVTKEFVDVEDKWYVEPIDFVVNNGLFGGTGTDTFSPDAPMTRGMFVTVLGRLAGAEVDPDAETKFVDVPADKWYAGYVKWAEENGIVHGVSETQFKPDAIVTREQICKMMVEYCNYAEITLAELNENASFNDADDISSWAVDYVEQAHKAGLVNGNENGDFRPLANATRAEAATVFMNFCNNYQIG